MFGARSVAATKTWSPVGDSENWHSSANWSPSGIPGDNDDVIVNTPGPYPSVCAGCDGIGITAPINSLTISAGASVATGNAVIVVDAPGAIGMTRLTGVDTRLIINAGNLNDGRGLATDNLEILQGAYIHSFRGSLDIGNTMLVDAVSEFSVGSGTGSVTIRFHNETGASGRLLNLKGLLDVRMPLIIEATNGGLLDLDGNGTNSGNATIDAFSTLLIDGEISDAFGGTLNVGVGREVTFTRDFEVDGDLRLIGFPSIDGGTSTITTPTLTIGGNGTLTFENTPDAVINGNAVFNAMTANVPTDATLTVNGTATLNSGALIDIASMAAVTIGNTAQFNAGSQIDIAHGGELATELSSFINNGAAIAADGIFRLNGTTTYKLATISGTGTVIQNGNAIVAPDAAGPAGTDVTTIDLDPATGVFDWDGGSNSNTSINNGAGLVINANRIDQGSATSDGYDGRVTVNGPLTVNTANPWRLDGEMVLNAAIVDGAKMIVHGTVTGDGDGTIGAAVDFVDGSLLHVRSGTETKLSGDVEFQARSAIQVDVGRVLSLGTAGSGETTWSGPTSVTGGGTIVQVGDAIVTAPTTIDLDTTTGVYDWDGGGGANVTIDANAALVINANRIDQGTAESDGYDGTVTVNGPLTVNTPGPWRLDGQAVLNGGTIDGAKMIVHGTVIGGGGAIDADVDFADASLLHVQSGAATALRGNNRFDAGSQVQVDAGRMLELGPTVWNGGTASGSGRLRQNGNATVTSSTTLNVTEYDADGVSGNSTLTIDSSLTLNVARIDSDNVYNGTANVNGFARWDVNLTDAADATWTMAGVVNVNASSAIPVRSIDGSRVDITGRVSVDGRMQFGALFDLSGEIETVDADTEVTIDGAVVPADVSTLSGGTIGGPGVLKASSPDRLVGHGAISTRIDFSGTSWLMADGGTLNVVGQIANLGQRVGTASPSGVLDIANAWNTNLADELWLEGGEVRGASITNGGTTTGHGSIAAAGFRNDGILTADGGTLTLDTTTSPDWDGGSGAGVVNALAGSISARNNSTNLARFNGQLNVGAGRLFDLENGGLHLISNGVMRLSGGRYQAPRLLQDASVIVDTAASVIEAESEFTANSENVLETELSLVGDALIRRGASFSGRGSLSVAKLSTLTAEGGVTISVPLTNAGRFELGASPGRVRIADYEQTETGVLHVEIGGTSASQMDLLIVDSRAELDGTLLVDLIAGYDPQPGEQLTIVTFDSLRGEFQTLDFALPSSRWPLRLDYQPDHLLLTATSIPGDINFDGSVDRGDAAELSRHFGMAAGALWQHGDFDGDRAVTLADAAIMQANYGRTTISAAAEQTAVPEPSSCAFVVAGLLSFLAIQRKRGRQAM